MGIVYLGLDPDGRRVAVKVIRAELSSDKRFRARFRSEVDRARQVPSFCTAEVLDADPDHETPYLVADFLDGPSLADIVQQRGPLSGGDLSGVAIGVATALAAIHGSGVVHRDLKPANVLFPLGTPRLIDFGIAKAVEAPSVHTIPGQLLGTIAYMAPERFESGKAAAVGPAADVFAWGVLVAYAATGRTPFGGDTPTATVGRIVTQPPDLSGLTGPLRGLVARAVEKDPARRPTALELVDRLMMVGSPGRAVRIGRNRSPELRQAAEPVRRVPGYRARHGTPTDPSVTDLFAGDDATTVVARSRGWWTRRRGLALFGALAVFGGVVAPPVGGLTTSIAGSREPRADAVRTDRSDRADDWRLEVHGL